MGTRDDQQDDDIEANERDIGANAEDIDANADNIDANADDIDDNRYDIDVNSDDIETNRNDIDAMDEFVLTPGEAAANPDQLGPSAAQRLRIHVPNVKTTLSMGAKAPSGNVRETDTGAPNYDGFGIHSDGHLFIDIEKGIGIQSEESAFIQSQANMAIGGKGSLVAGSRGGVVMAGGGGVTILGGAPNNWPANVDSDGTDPQEPKWVAPINDAAALITGVGSAVDAGLGAVATAKGFRSSVLGVKPTKLGIYNLMAWAGGAAGTLASAVGVVGGVTGYAGWNSDAVGALGDLAAGAFIYGQAGWIAATPVTMGLYSGAGTTIGSLAGVAINAVGGIELASVLDVEMASSKGETKVTAAKELTLKSGAGVAVVAKSGPVGLAGTTINLGAHTGAGGQAATESVDIDADLVLINGEKLGTTVTGPNFHANTGSVLLSAKTTATTWAKGSVSIESKNEHVSMSGKKHVEMTCGGTRVLVDGSQVMLGFGPGEAPAAPDPPELEKGPAAPNNLRKFYDYMFQKKARAKRNADKTKAHAKAMDDHAKACENLKKTKSGVIITKSAVEISVGGNKLKMDSGKVKHASLILK